MTYLRLALLDSEFGNPPAQASWQSTTKVETECKNYEIGDGFAHAGATQLEARAQFTPVADFEHSTGKVAMVQADSNMSHL